MRRTFSRVLHQCMAKDENIHVILADVGYGMFDEICKSYPKRVWNVGAAEQAAVGMAVGLALAGKTPIVYTISPFLLWRPAELIRNYMNGERVPVILVGSGRGRDYEHDGPTHWCEDDARLLSMFHNITALWPTSPSAVEDFLPLVIANKQPTYISLRR